MTALLMILMAFVVFVIIKILVPLNKFSNHISVKIDKATEQAKLEARERITKKVIELQKKYGKDGLLTIEEIKNIDNYDFKNHVGAKK